MKVWEILKKFRLKSFKQEFRRLSRISLFQIVVVLLFLWALGSVIIYIVERPHRGGFESLPLSSWYAIVSMLTVGYGDMVPNSGLGKFIAAITFVGGFILFSITTAIITSIITTRRLQETRGLERVKISNHIIICGSNLLLDSIIEGIRRLNKDEEKDIVLVNELSEEKANEIIVNHSPPQIKYVKGDFVNEAVLKRAGVSNASSVVVLADEHGLDRSNPDERTILATLSIRSLAPDATICAQIINETNETHLRRAGADEIVASTEYTGFIIASAVVTPGVPQMLGDMLSYDKSQRLMRIKIPKSFIGKSFKEFSSHLKKYFNAILIGVVSQTKGFGLSDILKDDASSIDQFIRKKFEEADKDVEEREGSYINTHLNPGDNYKLSEDEFAVIIGPSDIEI